MATKLKVGDKVTVDKDNYDEWCAGLTGTVVEIDGGEYLIQFSEEDANGNGHHDGNRCWWLVRGDLKVKKTPKGPQAYKGNGKHEWECVVLDTTLEFGTYRLRVPGGWLYATQDKELVFSNMTFVPVPDVVGYSI